MAKKKKEKEMVCLIEGQHPGLFGQKHSNRDYRYEDSWGKNQFNSSFPASLIAYMGSLGIEPVYLCTNKKNEIVHRNISSTNLRIWHTFTDTSIRQNNGLINVRY